MLMPQSVDTSGTAGSGSGSSKEEEEVYFIRDRAVHTTRRGPHDKIEAREGEAQKPSEAYCAVAADAKDVTQPPLSNALS